MPRAPVVICDTLPELASTRNRCASPRVPTSKYSPLASHSSADGRRSNSREAKTGVPPPELGEIQSLAASASVAEPEYAMLFPSGDQRGRWYVPTWAVILVNSPPPAGVARMLLLRSVDWSVSSEENAILAP